MTWSVVARKDFSDAIRSKVLWLLTALFVLFTAGFAYLFTLVGNVNNLQTGGEFTIPGLIGLMTSPVLLLVPLIGLLLGYKAVAGEVESGTSKILLSLPHRRIDVVVGKLVGRTGVLTATTLVGFVVAMLVVLVFYDSFDFVAYVAFALLTVVLSAIFVSIGIAISSATKSTGVATGAMLSVFVLFQFLWSLIPMGINYLVNGSFFVTGSVPAWYQFVLMSRPQTAFTKVVDVTFPNAQLPTTVPGESMFVSTEFAVAVLAFWLLVPVTLGYLRFRAMDI